MTAPDQTDGQQQQRQTDRDDIIAALAVWFGSSAAISAAALPPALLARLVASGLSAKAVRAAARTTIDQPLTGRRRGGSPAPRPAMTTAQTVAVDEPTQRARYLVNAAARLTEAEQLGVFPQARRREEHYLHQHTDAARNRARAAAELDRVATEAGPWLVWTTQQDSRVEADCRALEGTVFTVDRLPFGLIPGAVHPRCRCYARGLFDPAQPAPVIHAQNL